MRNTDKYFIEIVKEKIDSVVLSSDIRPATNIEISEEKTYYNKGNCRHRLVLDESGLFYDIRRCALCRAVIGVI